MSDNALMPKPHVLMQSGKNAFARYRPAFTLLQVFINPDDGRRVEINDDGHEVIFELSREQAQALAHMLTDEVQ